MCSRCQLGRAESQMGGSTTGREQWAGGGSRLAGLQGIPRKRGKRCCPCVLSCARGTGRGTPSTSSGSSTRCRAGTTTPTPGRPAAKLAGP
eukprot:8736041-Alexandrium_andersonii.AAC.1